MHNAEGLGGRECGVLFPTINGNLGQNHFPLIDRFSINNIVAYFIPIHYE